MNCTTCYRTQLPLREWAVNNSSGSFEAKFWLIFGFGPRASGFGLQVKTTVRFPKTVMKTTSKINNYIL